MLSEDAQRAASILHQTPGWRWRRKLSLTERAQQCQSGPTTRRRLPARQRQTRVRHCQSTCEEQCQNWRETLAGEATLDACEASSGHVRGALPELHGKGGACGLHRQNKIHAGVDSIVSKSLADNGVATPRDMRAAPLGDAEMAASERVRVAPPDSVVCTSAGSTARKQHLDECGWHH